MLPPPRGQKGAATCIVASRPRSVQPGGPPTSRQCTSSVTSMRFSVCDVCFYRTAWRIGGSNESRPASRRPLRHCGGKRAQGNNRQGTSPVCKPRQRSHRGRGLHRFALPPSPALGGMGCLWFNDDCARSAILAGVLPRAQRDLLLGVFALTRCHLSAPRSPGSVTHRGWHWRLHFWSAAGGITCEARTWHGEDRWGVHALARAL